MIHSPGQDNNTAGWCTLGGIAFTIKNTGDQPAAASTAKVTFDTAAVVAEWNESNNKAGGACIG